MLTISALICSPVLLALGLHSFEEGDVTGAVPIPATEQRVGDPKKGYEYLTTGDYLKSGVPYRFFTMAYGKDRSNLLHRDGKNATVSYAYNVVERDGVEIVVPTCLQCHAQTFNGQLVIGLGNTTLDFSNTRSYNVNLSRRVMKAMVGRKYAAGKDFVDAFAASFPEMQTEVRGVNAANKLAIVLAAHRDPQTLKWSDTALMNIPDEVFPTDVPPWWLLKKKNAMFYNGFARGDQAKFMMLANLLTVKDSTEAREVSSHFSDVLAYVRTIQPPKYPYTIDQPKAAQGKVLFEANCSRCHGTYGDGGNYPNLLIPLSIIQTDSTLCTGVEQNEALRNWFAGSWFVQGDNPAHLVPFKGYLAPPLDGIWITAPYLHNGSVPTLEALLNSSERPTYWSRDFSHREYDYKNVGWKYATSFNPERRKVYNTTLTGYSNGGHYFGDVLSAEERSAVIEYLKTL